MMHLGRNKTWEQMVEWLVVIYSDAPLAGLVIFVDVYLGVNCLVEQSLGIVACLQVDPVGVGSVPGCQPTPTAPVRSRRRQT